MKRLLLINDFENGGGAEQVFWQTKRLLSDKFIVKTFVGSKRHKRPEGLLSYIYSRNHASQLSRIYSVKNYKRLLEMLSAFRPDIVHLHNYYSSLSPSVLNAIRVYREGGGKIKVVFTAHDFHLLCPFSSFVYYPFFSDKPCRLKCLPNMFQILFYKWDNRGFPFSLVKKLQWVYAYRINDFDKEIDHIIAPGEFLAYLLKEKYNSIQVSVIRNPFIINMNAVSSGKPDPENKNNRTLKMVFTGRLSPEKGVIEFIECLRKIDDVCYEFRIIGDGPQKKEILKKIQRYNLQDRIILAGAMEHHLVLEELRRADALVLPSVWYENAPLSLIEGASMNLRLITADYGGMKEIAGLCGGGYLMEPGNFHSVKQAITSCYNDVASERPLKNRDAEMLGSLFSNANYINKLLDVYGA